MKTRNNDGYKMVRVSPKMYKWATKLAKTRNQSITFTVNQMLEDSVKLQTEKNLK